MMELATAVTSSTDLHRPAMKAHEYRKIVKPLLERRRRARINQCLTDLKALLLENNHNIDSNEASKLEKADILELTVRHLRELRRRGHSRSNLPSPQMPSSPTETNNEFRAGFTECAQEISACLTTLPGLDTNARNQILAHLGGYVSSTMTVAGSSTLPNSPLGPLTPPPSPAIDSCSPVTSPLDLTGREWMAFPSPRHHVVEDSPCHTHYRPAHHVVDLRRRHLPQVPSNCWRPW